MEKFRVTYATLSADNDELHRRFDEAAEAVVEELGQKHPLFLSDQPRWSDQTYTALSPADSAVTLGTFAQGTPDHIDEAVQAASEAALAWDRLGWRRRVEILRRAADLLEERLFPLAALMSYEVGKNRLEALGDVQETAELIRWNCDEVEKHDGFHAPMSGLGAPGDYYDVLRPYGVWAVISPFNFPMALSGGPTSAALVAGNTVVLKPSNAGALSAHRLAEAYREAGVPQGVFHLVTGGDDAGAALAAHPGVAGLTFTGSYAVGMQLHRSFSREYPKPIICEMGGKNATIVTAHADLEKATDGVMRSAFGLSGQKCSACSRVYVDRSLLDEFVAMLSAKASALTVGNPLQRDTSVGPVIDAAAVERFREAVAEARRVGAVHTGGEILTGGDLSRGTYVQPTVVTAPLDSWLWSKELFVPLVAVAPVDSLEEAIALANGTEYGLTAGFFSEDQTEIDRWLESIHAGVVYVNRPAGATTGAWPGVQPFGGWKGSGTTGKAGGGPYYVTQYAREQSRTVIS
jgi:1-pyrroline-5-carboxylate dehydrogenase